MKNIYIISGASCCPVIASKHIGKQYTFFLVRVSLGTFSASYTIPAEQVRVWKRLDDIEDFEDFLEDTE